MYSSSLTSGAFAVPSGARFRTGARAGRTVRATGTRSTVADWRLRRGCGATFEVYGARGEFLGQMLAPCHPAEPQFQGETVYLDRTHLAVLPG